MRGAMLRLTLRLAVMRRGVGLRWPPLSDAELLAKPALPNSGRWFQVKRLWLLDCGDSRAHLHQCRGCIWMTSGTIAKGVELKRREPKP
jgi:hypothetical protein